MDVNWTVGLELVPIAEADFDVGIFADEHLEFLDIAAAVMVRANDFGFEFAHGAGGLFDGHGVREVHANKSQVDVLEGAHFGDIFGIAADINAFAAGGNDITVAAAFFMVLKAVGCEIVHGDGFNGDVADGFFLAVGEDRGSGAQRFGQFFGDGLGSDEGGFLTGDGAEGFGMEMIVVNIRDENQSGLVDAFEFFGTADGIDIDGLVFPAQGEGGMIDGMDDEGAVLGGNGIAGDWRFSGSGVATDGQAGSESEEDAFIHGRNDGLRTARIQP